MTQKNVASQEIAFFHTNTAFVKTPVNKTPVSTAMKNVSDTFVVHVSVLNLMLRVRLALSSALFQASELMCINIAQMFPSL